MSANSHELARRDYPVWLVGLKGDEHVLRYLAEETRSDTLCVRRLRRGWVLFADRLQACATADEVSAAAPDFIRLANHVRRRAHPLGADLEATGEYRLHPSGRLEVYTSMIERFAITDGLSEGAEEGTAATYCDRFVTVALNDPHVSEIIRYREAPDAGGWSGLRRVVEAIAKNMAGGRSKAHAARGYQMIAGRGWAQMEWLRNLGDIANSSGAGDSARHGLSHMPPPPDAMGLDEARRGVDALYYRWIDWKLSKR